MPDSLRYRTATIEDLPEIVKIYNSVIPGRMVTADLTPISVESRKIWFETHRGNRPLLMISCEDKTAGWMSFTDFYGREAYNSTAEISIYLDENFRGKGLGKEILQYATDLAPDLEIKTLLAFIFGHNLPSIRLFTSSGFTVSGNLPKVAVLDGTERDLLILMKKV